MHLVQLFVPLTDADGHRIERDRYRALRDELSATFGGVTIFARAPAQGLWQPRADAPAERDDIVIFEVMTAELDRSWWRRLRMRLEIEFAQEQIVIRAMAYEPL